MTVTLAQERDRKGRVATVFSQCLEGPELTDEKHFGAGLCLSKVAKSHHPNTVHRNASKSIASLAHRVA